MYRGKLKRLTYYFDRKQHGSVKFEARERFERNSRNCCQRENGRHAKPSETSHTKVY